MSWPEAFVWSVGITTAGLVVIGILGHIALRKRGEKE